MDFTTAGGPSCCHRVELWHTDDACYATYRYGCSQRATHEMLTETWDAAVLASLAIVELIALWGPPANATALAALAPLERSLGPNARTDAAMLARAIREHASAYSAAYYGTADRSDDRPELDRHGRCVTAASVLEAVAKVGRESEPGRSVNEALRLTGQLCEEVQHHPVSGMLAQAAALVSSGLDPRTALDTAQAVTA